MRSLTWKPAVALGALLAIGGSAGAQDTVRLGGSAANANGAAGSDTVTLGGKGTLESAREGDSELTRYYGGGRGGYRGGFYGGYRGGYRGGYWGGGYRGGYWGGYRGGYWAGHRGWGYGGYYRPYYGVSIGLGTPYYSGYYGTGYYGGYCGISANPADLATPAVPLNATAQAVPVIRIPAGSGNETYRYDGSPPAPQPLNDPRVVPNAAPKPIVPPVADTLKVAFVKDTAANVKTAYTFKAYGEK